MTQVCPVSNNQISVTIIRLNALFVSALIVSFLFSSMEWIIIFLAADYFIRGFVKRDLSMIKGISTFLAEKLNINTKSINAGPKIFAAKIGFYMSLLAIILSLTGHTILSILVALTLLTFSVLEGAFSFCVACKIYPFFYKSSYLPVLIALIIQDSL